LINKLQKELFLICIIQVTFFICLYFLKAEPAAFFIAAIIAVMSLLQGILDIKNTRKVNILFPNFLFDHQVVIAIILFAFGVTPFAYCMLTGDIISPLYDVSAAHNNTVGVVTNICGVGGVVCVLKLMSRSRDLTNYAKRGFPYQSVVQSMFMVISFVCLLFYMVEAERGHVVSLHVHTHNLLNCIYLFSLFYLLLSSAFNVAAYFFQLPGSERPYVFTRNDMLLLEPYVIALLVLGVVTSPGEKTFIHFLVFTPATIVVSILLIGFFAVETKNDKTMRPSYVATSFRTIVGIGNLIIYALIVSVHYQTVWVLVPFGALGVWFLMSVSVGSVNRWLAKRKCKMAIQQINKAKRDEDWLDKKLNEYHRLRQIL